MSQGPAPGTASLLALRAEDHPAPAKINLALHVTGRRPDGYHELSSLVAFADIGDGLTIGAAAADTFEVTGPFGPRLAASLPDGGRNIVLAALEEARAVARIHRHDIAPMRIVLDKRLPVASGIGGGSADAAALLRLVSRAAPALAGPLLRASVALGADVPMCLGARAARIAGIGEVIEPVRDFPDVAAVLVNPGVPVSTPSVFARLASRKNPPMPQCRGFSGLAELLSYLGTTRNDLEPPAIETAPVIADVRQALGDTGALFVRMSGSGATVFGLYADRASAETAAAAIRARHAHWWAASTLLGSRHAEAQ